MGYQISKKMDDKTLIIIMEMGAEAFYEVVRAEILDRMSKKVTTPPAKRRGRPPKDKDLEAGIQPTGEFVRSRPAPKKSLRRKMREGFTDFDSRGNTAPIPVKKSRRFSAATRKKMAESQRKRWAKAAKKKKK